MKIIELLKNNRDKIITIMDKNSLWKPKLYKDCENLNIEDGKEASIVIESDDGVNYWDIFATEIELEKELGIKIELVSKGGLKGEYGKRILKTLVDF